MQKLPLEIVFRKYNTKYRSNSFHTLFRDGPTCHATGFIELPEYDWLYVEMLQIQRDSILFPVVFAIGVNTN